MEMDSKFLNEFLQIEDNFTFEKNIASSVRLLSHAQQFSRKVSISRMHTLEKRF